VREGSAPEPDGDLPAEVRRRLPERDPAALQAFFDHYFDRVWGYVRRMVRDEHLAEDLTQDVFLQVQRALHTYDPERSLRPWVFTIATNKLRDHWRSARQREVWGEEEENEAAGVAERFVSEDPGAAQELSQREMAELLHRAIDELPDGMRAALVLRVFEGLSFEAIGAALDRSNVAVRKRYSRALELLRGSLAASWQTHVEGGSGG
jgi:RNA polymerase sigma-70 factor (ECF subfamily)